MSKLVAYLNKNHQNTEYIVDDFLERFGVNAKNEDGFWIFKYSKISGKFTESLTHECRGPILKLDGEGWRYCSRPWDKFFNQHEGYCPLHKEEAFNSVIDDLYISEKADGTCIQLWFDGYIWRPSTLGSIKTGNVPAANYSFRDLFYETVTVYSWKLNPRLTYLLELCCEENRIVTRYTHNHAVLLGCRDIETGEYYPPMDMAGFKNVRLPIRDKVTDIGLSNLFDVKKFVEKESENHEKYGQYPEGFVIYKNNQPIVKFKNKKYLSLHSVSGGDIPHAKNQIIDAIFLGYLDDIYDVLADSLKSFANTIKDKVNHMEDVTLHQIKSLGSRSYNNRKDFALSVKDSVPANMQPFFFQNIDKFLSGSAPNADDFEYWLKTHYKKFNWEDLEKIK